MKEIEEIYIKDEIKKILEKLDLLLEKNRDRLKKGQEIEELFEEFPNVNSPHSVRSNDWLLAELQRIARKKNWSTQSAVNKALLLFIDHYQEDFEDQE